MGQLSIRSVGLDESTAPDPETRRKEDLLELARERFRVAALAEDKRRTEMLIDMKFFVGQQWDEWVELRRRQQGRPCLTINREPGFVKHVSNALRQSRPEIKVDPVADGADEEIAQIRQGIIRYIGKISQADIAYDTGFLNMLIMGLGFIRVVDNWSGPKSMDKDLYIQWVPNTFAVYFDPAAAKPDWSDAKYCFIVEDISLPEFKARYGNRVQAVSLEGFQSIGDHAPFWIPGGKIRIAEYFYKELETKLLLELRYRDGHTECKYSDEVPVPEVGKEDLQDFEVISSRSEKVETVKWALMSGLDILKERDWYGQYIPVIPFIGTQIELDGERILKGMVRDSRESQRMFNYAYTTMVEAIALAPKAPFIAEFNQIQRFREIWERANTDPMAVLPYESVSAENGAPLPAPQRQQAEPPIAALVQLLKIADDNLKSTFSIYDASLGQRGPQESGLAINSRKVESDQATFDYIDNFHRGQIYLGIVLDDLLKYYYNKPGRILQITGEDDKSMQIAMNLPFKNAKGTVKFFDLSQPVKCAISLATGPNYQTKRKEQAEGILELSKTFPQQMGVALPQLIREQDWSGAEAIAAQVEKTLPPELRQQDPNEGGPPPLPVEVQQQLSQSQQMIQKLSALVNELSDKNMIQERKEQWETLRKEMDGKVELAANALRASSQEAMFLSTKIFEELSYLRAKLDPVTVDAPPAPASAAGQPPAPAQPSSPAPVGAPPGATPPA